MNHKQSWSHFKHGVNEPEFKEQLRGLGEDELRDVHKIMLRKRFAGKTSAVTGVTGALPTGGVSLISSFIGVRRAHINSERIGLIEERLEEQGWKGHKMGIKDYALPITLGVVGLGLGLDAALHHAAEAAMAPQAPLDPSMMNAGAGMVSPVDPSLGAIDPTGIFPPPIDPSLGAIDPTGILPPPIDPSLGAIDPTGIFPPPIDPSLGTIDPTGVFPPPVDQFTTAGGGLPLYDPTMMEQAGFPTFDPTAGIGTAPLYDPTTMAQSAFPTVDPTAGMGTTFPYDPTMLDTSGLLPVDPTAGIGSTLPYDPTLMGQSGFPTIDPTAGTGYPPALSGNQIWPQPFGATSGPSGIASNVVSAATHITPHFQNEIHRGLHKGSVKLAKKAFGNLYYKVVDREKHAVVGAALPQEQETARHAPPQMDAVNNTTPDIRVGAARTLIGSTEIKNIKRDFPMRSPRSWIRRVVVKGPKGSPDGILRAVAVQTFYRQEGSELSFKEGDKIDILERTNNGKDWWLGRNGSFVGLFPSDMIQILDKAIARYSFNSEAEDELGFGEGDVIEVVERTESKDGWWIGRIGTSMGVFPASYVEDWT
jgi:hypothetical protein